MPIVAAGAGCLLVRRTVLEDPRMRLPGSYVSAFGEPRDLAEEPDAAPAIFRMPTKANGEPLLGEDMDFVYRAHLLGVNERERPRLCSAPTSPPSCGGYTRVCSAACRQARTRRGGDDQRCPDDEIGTTTEHAD